MGGTVVPVNSLERSLYHLVEHEQEKRHRKGRSCLFTAKPPDQNMPPHEKGGGRKHADHQNRHDPRNIVIKIHGAHAHQKAGYIRSLPVLIKVHVLPPRLLHGSRKRTCLLPDIVHPPAVIVVVNAHHIIFSQPE